MTRCSCHSHSGFLTRRGILVAQQTSLEGLAPRGEGEYVDKVGSVSVSGPGPDLYAFTTEQLLEAQSERFHNGT